MPSRKVVQTELEQKEYDLLVSVAKSKGVTIKEAAKQALVQWSVESSDIASDPIFKLKPFPFKRKIKSSEIDQLLYS